MNISQIIKYLERKPADKIVPMGFSSPGAYRGDYKCLGVEPTPDISVRDMLFAVRYALGTTYQGLNGGSHMMMPGTKVYLAPYGKTGELITRVSLDEMLSTHDKNEVVRPRTVRQLDAALKAMNVSYCVHHTLFESPMPRAVTIAKKGYIYEHDLNMCLLHIDRAISRGDVADGESVGAFVKHQLAKYGYKHVAVCSRGDEFDQIMGETIALGRLLKAQRNHIMPGYRRLPALPSRRRDTRCVPLPSQRRSDAQRRPAVVRAKTLAKLRAMFATTNPRCVLHVSASDETTASVISPMKRYEDTTQDVVIGCGRSLEYHTSDDPSHFMFCRDCSYTYSDDPDSKCSRYRVVYSLIGPRRIIRAYESDE